MKRFFLVLVLIGVSGLALFAAWAGMRARTGYVAAVHEVGGHPDVRVIESEFKRGWMRSTAETTLEVHGQPGAAFRLLTESLGAKAVRPRIGFQLRHEFLHGPASLWSWIATGFPGSPVMVEVRTWAELDHESQRDAEVAVGRLPALLASTWVRLGGTTTDLFLPAGRSQAQDGARAARWQNLDGMIEPHGGHLTAHGRLGGLVGEGGTLEIRVQGVEWEVDSTRGSATPARVSIRMPALLLRRRVPGAPWIAVHDVELGQAQASSHGPHAAMAYLRFVRAEIDAAVYGPARFEIVAESAVADDGLPEPPEADRAVRRVERALELLPGFVLRAPRAEFTRLFLNSPAGPLRGGGELHLVAGGGGAIRDARLDLEAPAGLLEALHAAWSGAEAGEGPPWHEDWQAKGLLVRSGERMRLRARVREGTLTLNRVTAEEVFTFADEEEEEVAGEAGADEVPPAAEGDADASAELADAAAGEGEGEAAEAAGAAQDAAQGEIGPAEGDGGAEVAGEAPEPGSPPAAPAP